MKHLLLKVNGTDHPGITSKLMQCIESSPALIEDMGQSITHGLLSLSILLKIQNNPDNIASLKSQLATAAKELDIQLDISAIEDEKQVAQSGDKFILSCVNLDGISAGFLSDISQVLAKNNINIQRIENTTPGEFISLDIATIAQSHLVDWERIKEELLSISNTHATDLALLKDDIWRRHKRLIVFDMDSTLIQNEVIVEMAKVHGVGDEVHQITEDAMNGIYDFDQSLKERVKLLKGMQVSKLDEILSQIKLTPGVKDFIKTVKKLGYKIAIISGGFNFFANHFKESLGLDYAFSNELEISEGALTGQVKGGIVNAEKKAMLLDMIAQSEGIDLQQVVAIGDGANDLQMLAKAGLGIAFHAKEIVKKSAKQHMSHGPMTTVLYFLGIPGNQE
jgi:phosphoserine phosphatase